MSITFGNLREVDRRKRERRHTADYSCKNILNQQWACMFMSDVYIKPDDLKTGTNTQTRKSEFFRVIAQLTDPFLFEDYFIVHSSLQERRDFWEAGNCVLLRGKESDSYYKVPDTSHLKTLLLLCRVEEEDPYIKCFYLIEMNMARPAPRSKGKLKTAVVPICDIVWNTSSYSFEKY